MKKSAETINKAVEKDLIYMQHHRGHRILAARRIGVTIRPPTA